MDPMKDLDVLIPEENYPLVEPWEIGHGSQEVERHGTTFTENYTVVYSTFVPGKLDGQPSLKMLYDCPFYELRGKSWLNFKKRVEKFTEKYSPCLPSVGGGVLEDLKARIRDDHDR